MIPTENLRFREESLTFKISETADELQAAHTQAYNYPAMTATLGDFKLHVEPGDFADSEIIVLLGENGMGKTTFVKLLGGKLEPDDPKDKVEMRVSMKPQTSEPASYSSSEAALIARVPSLSEIPGDSQEPAPQADKIHVHA